MSRSNNSIVQVQRVNFCDVCDLVFETKTTELYKHQSYDLKHKEILEKMIDSETKTETKAKTETKTEFSDKTVERVYDPDEDDYILNPKTIPNPKLKDHPLNSWEPRGKASFTHIGSVVINSRIKLVYKLTRINSGEKRLS